MFYNICISLQNREEREREREKEMAKEFIFCQRFERYDKYANHACSMPPIQKKILAENNRCPKGFGQVLETKHWLAYKTPTVYSSGQRVDLMESNRKVHKNYRILRIEYIIRNASKKV